jgi:integrase
LGSPANAQGTLSAAQTKKIAIRKHIEPHIGARKLSELTSDDVRFLLRRWKDDEVGLVTRRTAFVTLSCALNVAFREDKMARNPCETVPRPKPPRPEVSVRDGKQVMKLLAASRNARDQALLTLAVTTGMRQGEIFALTWDDIELAARTISIKRTLAEDRQGHLVRSEPKTPKSRRIIYLPELARTALTALRAESDSPSGFVFTSAAGTPLRKNNFLKRVFKPLLRRRNCPMSRSTVFAIPPTLCLSRREKIR